MALNTTIATSPSLPGGQGVLATASQVEVYERWGAATSFRLTLNLAQQESDFPLISSDEVAPGTKVTITVGGAPGGEVLTRGIITGQAAHFEHGSTASSLTVIGFDECVLMDRVSKGKVWADGTDSNAVQVVLGEYGFTPDVESTNAGHTENKHSLVQRETDLRFVRRLARRNGYLFWLSHTAASTTAHFKKPPLSGEAELTLRINRDGANLDQFDLVWDVERPTSVVCQQLDLNAKEGLDGDSDSAGLRLLGSKGLSDVSSEERSLHLCVPADDAGDLAGRSSGALRESEWFIRGACVSSTSRLGGKIVRAHRLVRVEGLGGRHDGLWFVTGVHHNIDLSSHRMRIELARNGWNEGGR